MKKEKKRIQVLRRMTEGDIKALGGNLWVRQRLKVFTVAVILSFAWLLVGNALLEGRVAFMATVVPIVALFLWWMWRFDKEGKNLWNKVKDKEQPVDLG